MSEQRFTVMKKFDGSYVICDKGKMLVADDCCDLLNEQQATIRRLQDLCGQSDSENAKLRIENEQLKKQLEIRTESDKYHQRMLMKWLCKDEGDDV